MLNQILHRRSRDGHLQSNCQRSKQSGQRSAVTLIELLIVLGLLTILATLSLTTLKGLLKDQKVSHATRLVEQYLDSARIRAITNGLPVAVYLERVSVITNDTSGTAPFPPHGPNYYATRLTTGEVFPPYTGDVVGATGTLQDIDFSTIAATITTRDSDGFADQIVFNEFDVATGFGPGGFISPGDIIEFEGYEGRFVIESISAPTSGLITVRFFNPPKYKIIAGSPPTVVTYDQALDSKAQASRHPVYEVSHSRAPTAMPLYGLTPEVKFRAYRRPSKSLVGSITLPRGTCVDLAASGIGRFSAGGGDTGSMFSLASAPWSDNPADIIPASYSRVGLLFSSEGKLAGIFLDDKFVQTSGAVTTSFPQAETTSLVHLMVGRSEQVMPGVMTSAATRRAALIQRADPNAADQVKSNLMDEANSWITLNPFTGEIRSAPVNRVADATLATALADLTDDAAFGAVVDESRLFTTSGVKQQ